MRTLGKHGGIWTGYWGRCRVCLKPRGKGQDVKASETGPETGRGKCRTWKRQWCFLRWRKLGRNSFWKTVKNSFQTYQFCNVLLNISAIMSPFIFHSLFMYNSSLSEAINQEQIVLYSKYFIISLSLSSLVMIHM